MWHGPVALALTDIMQNAACKHCSYEFPFPNCNFCPNCEHKTAGKIVHFIVICNERFVR